MQQAIDAIEDYDERELVDFRIPANKLLDLLLDRKLFTEARRWVKDCNELLDPVPAPPTEVVKKSLEMRSKSMNESIVFQEVTGYIIEFKTGVWWAVLSERLVLWKKCYDIFLQHNYPHLLAATFFVDL